DVGEDVWLSQKTNNTQNTATLITQSSTTTCQQGLETWGAFISDNSGTPESWYSFYANEDGVADIILSTANQGVQVKIYYIDESNNQLIEVVNTIPPQDPYKLDCPISGRGRYIYLRGLKPNRQYFIKVTGFNFYGISD